VCDAVQRGRSGGAGKSSSSGVCLLSLMRLNRLVVVIERLLVKNVGFLNYLRKMSIIKPFLFQSP